MFESVSSFSTGKKSGNKCKTYESDVPPEYRGNSVLFVDNKTGVKSEVPKERVDGFKRKSKDGKEVYRIKICGK